MQAKTRPEPERVLVLVHVLGTRRDVAARGSKTGDEESALLTATGDLERCTRRRVSRVSAVQLAAAVASEDLTGPTLAQWAKSAMANTRRATAGGTWRTLTVYRAQTVLDDAHDPACVRRALRGPAGWTRAGARERSANTTALLEEVLAETSRSRGRRDVVISAYAGTSASWAVLLEEVVDRLIAAASAGDRVFLLLPSVGKAAEARLLPVREVRAEDEWASPAAMLERARAIPPDVPVLLLGESGSGKSRQARLLHERWWAGEKGARKGEGLTMRVVNAASLSPALASAELFGAKKGAFTGADEERVGVFGEFGKAKGTLFLDEVGELPAETQAQLLTALDPRKGDTEKLGWNIRKVGSSAEQSIPVEQLRIVLATNRDLRSDKGFRADLLARIGAVQITMPSLDEARHRVIPAWLECVRARIRAREGVRAVVVRRDAAHELAAAVFDEGNVLPRNFRGVQDAALRTALQCFVGDGASSLGGAQKDLVISTECVRAGLGAMLERRTSAGVPASAEVRAEERAVSVLRFGVPLPLGAEFEAFVRPAGARWSQLERYEAWLLWSARRSKPNGAQAWEALVKSGAVSSSAEKNRNPSDAFRTRWKRLFGNAEQPG